MPRKGAEPDTSEITSDEPVEAAEPKEERKPGPVTTRTGAKGLAVQTEGGVRTFTAGGEKGNRITELLQDGTERTRKEIAEIVGCSPSRVAEVARVLGMTKERKKIEPVTEEASA